MRVTKDPLNMTQSANRTLQISNAFLDRESQASPLKTKAQNDQIHTDSDYGTSMLSIKKIRSKSLLSSQGHLSSSPNKFKGVNITEKTRNENNVLAERQKRGS